MTQPNYVSAVRHFRATGSIRNASMLLLIVMLCGCASLRKSDQRVQLDSSSFYYLQAVPVQMQGLAILQKLAISSTAGQQQLLLQTELTQDHIKMVGLSLSGLTLFELSWRKNSQLTIKSNVVVSGLKAEVMLAYYQLSNWPIVDIRSGLQGMTVKMAGQDNNLREFYRDTQLVFSVRHDGQHRQLIHHQDLYQIDIDTLQIKSLNPSTDI